MPQTPKWDVVVIGGINSDFLIRGSKLPSSGETVEGKIFLEGPGGKGANQAVAARRLGARVAIVGRVGIDPRGKAMIERLRREGVETRYIARDDRFQTGAALVMVEESGEKQILTAPGANAVVGPEDVRRAARAIRAASVVLANLEVPTEAVAEAFQIARAAKRRTMLDPAPPRTLEPAIFQHIDLVRPNAAEAQALTGISVVDQDSARAAARALLDRGVEAAVIQAGQEGNLLVWRDGEHWFERIPVESVDSTGAGDAFAGAMAFGLARQKSPLEAARLANAAAALATTKLGAQSGLPVMEEVERLLEKAA